MSVLFVIEARYKVDVFSAALARLNIDARVQATLGHLYSFPNTLTPVGIDNTFREFERKPKNLKSVEWLRKMAAESERVYIATDADAEGDVIAWDVAETIRDTHAMPLRVRLRGMDDESIREAIDAAEVVRKEDAVPGRTRAIVDRLIGAGFSKDGVAVGRVSTALLGLVQQMGPGVNKLVLVAPAKDGGRPYSAEVPVKAPITQEVAARLAKIQLPALEMRANSATQAIPDHTGDILVKASEMFDAKPGEVAQAMQEQYMAGRMSYPRAGSRGLSSTTAKKMASILKKAGYARADSGKFKLKTEDDVHDAPHPIGKVSPDENPKRMSLGEGVRTMVSRDMIRVAQGTVDEMPVITNVVPFLEQSGFSREVAVAVAKLHWRREVGPRYPGQESWPESKVVSRRADAVLLEKAIDIGLGRPSTWGKHIDLFMDRGLVNDDLSLTAKGRHWIANSPVELLDPRVSIAIEQACERYNPVLLDHDEREAWELNADRIVNVLPENIKTVLRGLVDHEPPRPKIDPIVAYGEQPNVLLEAEALRTAAPTYSPTMGLTDY